MTVIGHIVSASQLVRRTKIKESFINTEPLSLNKVIKSEDTLFQTDVDVGNVYKNPPNPATEEAWEKITSGLFLLSFCVNFLLC